MEDMNSFIHLAKQMGLINQRFYNYLPNATVCKGNEPQIDNDHVVIVKLRNIYGMLVLLALGISVALTSFIAENLRLLCGSPRSLAISIFLSENISRIPMGYRAQPGVKKEAWK